MNLRKNIPEAFSSVALSLFLAVSAIAQQTGQTPSTPVSPAPSANTPPAQSAPPASSSGVSAAPSANSQQGSQTPPASNARPLTTDAQTQQSTQPTTQARQQTRGATPTEGTTVQPANPAADQQTGLQPTGQQPQGPVITPPQPGRPPGRESVPTPATDALPNVPTIAPDYRAPQSPLPEMGRVGVEMSEQKPLTLREALEMALTNNKDIEVARQNVRIAEFDLNGARGVYDPRFSTLSYYERSETPSSSFLSGGSNGAVTQSDVTSTARFEGLTPRWGGGYRVDFSAIRLTTNNQFAALNPQYPTALTFNYTQPLLRGLKFDINRRQIEIARKNLSLTDAQFRQRAIETITAVQRAYWDLVFALRNLQIQRDAVRDARTQLEHNRRLVTEGNLAPIDVVAAEAQVSGFEQSVYTALEDVSRAENNLKNLTARNREDALWNVSIIPTDPVSLEPAAVSLPQAMEDALKNRTELQQSDVARAINEIDQRYYREQTKPQLDIIGSYGVVGLAGALNSAAASNPLTSSTAMLRERVNQLSTLAGLQPIPTPPSSSISANLIGGYPQSFENLLANRYNNLRVGVQLNLPIHNRTAEAQLGRSLVEGERIKTQREQLEQLIQVDVRNALQTLRTAQSRLRAAAAAREASEQQYTSEQRKLDAGQSTVFLVLERQTQLTTARGNELRAQTDLNKAIAELQRATGDAMHANNVVVRVR